MPVAGSNFKAGMDIPVFHVRHWLNKPAFRALTTSGGAEFTDIPDGAMLAFVQTSVL